MSTTTTRARIRKLLAERAQAAQKRAEKLRRGIDPNDRVLRLSCIAKTPGHPAHNRVLQLLNLAAQRRDFGHLA